MRNMAVIDAGPLIALFDKSDKYHEAVKSSLEEWRGRRYGRLMTTWPIITEVCHMLAGFVHPQAQWDCLEWIFRGGLVIFDLRDEHLLEIISLQKKYATLPMDFADATLIVAAENTDIDKVFSVDKDFEVYRIPGRKHFENFLKRK